MTTLENIRNRLIDKILATKNEELLEAIEKIISSTQHDNKFSLSSEQIEMLTLSEEDIEYGKLISESDLQKTDDEWLG